MGKRVCRPFMPLLTELGALRDEFCYKHVAPDGAYVLQHSAFQQSYRSVTNGGLETAAPWIYRK
jgi:hypothetical protein